MNRSILLLLIYIAAAVTACFLICSGTISLEANILPLLHEVIGPAATIFAGWLAWQAIQAQINHSDKLKAAENKKLKDEDAYLLCKRLSALATDFSSPALVTIKNIIEKDYKEISQIYDQARLFSEEHNIYKPTLREFFYFGKLEFYLPQEIIDAFISFNSSMSGFYEAWGHIINACLIRNDDNNEELKQKFILALNEIAQKADLVRNKCEVHSVYLKTQIMN